MLNSKHTSWLYDAIVLLWKSHYLATILLCYLYCLIRTFHVADDNLVKVLHGLKHFPQMPLSIIRIDDNGYPLFLHVLNYITLYNTSAKVDFFPENDKTPGQHPPHIRFYFLLPFMPCPSIGCFRLLAVIIARCFYIMLWGHDVWCLSVKSRTHSILSVRPIAERSASFISS